MARTKGSKNKITSVLPDICNLTPKERIDLLANLIIDRILEDQNNGHKLIKNIGDNHDTRKVASA